MFKYRFIDKLILIIIKNIYMFTDLCYIFKIIILLQRFEYNFISIYIFYGGNYRIIENYLFCICFDVIFFFIRYEEQVLLCFMCLGMVQRVNKSLLYEVLLKVKKFLNFVLVF